MTNVDLLKRLDACDDAIKYANMKTDLNSAWTDCERGDWMLWLVAKLNVDRKSIVLAACDCAELSSPYWPKDDDRPRLAIEAARRWAEGAETIEAVRKAAYAASAATSAAYAAYAAASAAYAAAYAASAAYAAGKRIETLRKSADIVRCRIPWEMVEQSVQEYVRD